MKEESKEYQDIMEEEGKKRRDAFQISKFIISLQLIILCSIGKGINELTE